MRPVEGGGAICSQEGAAIFDKILLSPLKYLQWGVRNDNFILCQVQRKTGRKFLGNSAHAEKLSTPFLKRCMFTLLCPFCNSFIIYYKIVNAQRHLLS